MVSLTTVCFLSTRVNKERCTGKIPGGVFRDAQGFGRLEAGTRASFTGSRPLLPWTSLPHFSLFLRGVALRTWAS